MKKGTDQQAPNPHARSVRSLSLRDGMVLIAAITVGQAGWVALRTGAFYRGAAGDLVPRGLTGFISYLSISALALSWSIVGLNICGNRPHRRRLFSQPGFVACFAIVIASVADWLMELRHLTLNNNLSLSATVFWSYLHSGWPPKLAPVILVSWLAFWLGRRFRGGSNSIDIVGALVGVFVLVSAVVVTLEPLVH